MRVCEALDVTGKQNIQTNNGSARSAGDLKDMAHMMFQLF
jgi:hypothetical protein